MKGIHNSNLHDNEKNLYVFNKDVINQKLLNELQSVFDVASHHTNLNIKNINLIELVPSEEYFLYINGDEYWSCKNKIFISKKQVDKFLNLITVLPMNFLEFMELELQQ